MPAFSTGSPRAMPLACATPTRTMASASKPHLPVVLFKHQQSSRNSRLLRLEAIPTSLPELPVGQLPSPLPFPVTLALEPLRNLVHPLRSSSAILLMISMHRTTPDLLAASRPATFKQRLTCPSSLLSSDRHPTSPPTAWVSAGLVLRAFQGWSASTALLLLEWHHQADTSLLQQPCWRTTTILVAASTSI